MKSPAEIGRYQILAPRTSSVAAPAVHRSPAAGAAGARRSDLLVTARRDPMTSEDVMVPLTETEQLRQQLLQAQRLSSVGALASSMAHEFNNILTTIINYAKLAVRNEGNEAARTQ